MLILDFWWTYQLRSIPFIWRFSHRSDWPQPHHFYYFAFITVLPQFSFHKILLLLLCNYIFFIIFPPTITLDPNFFMQLKYFPNMFWFSCIYIKDSIIWLMTSIEPMHLSKRFTFAVKRLKSKFQLDRVQFSVSRKVDKTSILQHYFFFTYGGSLEDHRWVI